MKARATAILALFAATACGPLRTGAHSDSSYFPMSADRLWEYHLRLQNGDVWPVVGTTDGVGFDIRWSGSISREESVVVPAGVFLDCLRIESIALHRMPMDD